MEKARIECNKLINLVKKNKVAQIYRDEVKRTIYKFDSIKYLSIYKHRKISDETGVYFKMDNRGASS